MTGREMEQEIVRLQLVASTLLEALKAVLAEWREGYGLNCVDQVQSAIALAESAASVKATEP